MNWCYHREMFLNLYVLYSSPSIDYQAKSFFDHSNANYRSSKYDTLEQYGVSMKLIGFTKISKDKTVHFKGMDESYALESPIEHLFYKFLKGFHRFRAKSRKKR